METVKTHHIFIKSSMRQTGTNDDYVVTLNNPLVLTNQRNKFRVQIGESVIPHTINQINSDNSTLSYQIVKGAVNYNGSVILTTGNYNIITLLDEMKAKLKDDILIQTSLAVNFVFTYVKTVSGVVLSIIGNDGIICTITLKFSLNTVLGGFFGYTFNAVFSYNSFNISSNSSSDISVNVNPINNIYIRSNSLVQRESYESIIEKDVFSDILAKVPVNVSPGSFIFFGGTLSFIEIENKVIDQISLYLSNNLSYSLSLNGLTWNTHLIFEEFGINEPDNLLKLTEPPQAQTVDNTEVLNQIEELKKQIDDSKKSPQG